MNLSSRSVYCSISLSHFGLTAFFVGSFPVRCEAMFASLFTSLGCLHHCPSFWLSKQTQQRSVSPKKTIFSMFCFHRTTGQKSPDDLCATEGSLPMNGHDGRFVWVYPHSAAAEAFAAAHEAADDKNKVRLSSRAAPCRAMPCRAVPRRAVPCHAALCRAVRCSAVLCGAAPRRAALRHATPCAVMPTCHK